MALERAFVYAALACRTTPRRVGLPFARPRCVTYGPNLNSAAVLLVSEGNVAVEHATLLLDGLAAVAVLSGLIACVNARLAE
ncbi:hypothetical protein Franean1_3418 [Parafrankia sp. EAN1pec]|nr:hypothetical protein Franean1_3418 [Frankia sp. EAN1pec]